MFLIGPNLHRARLLSAPAEVPLPNMNILFQLRTETRQALITESPRVSLARGGEVELSCKVNRTERKFHSHTTSKLSRSNTPYTPLESTMERMCIRGVFFRFPRARILRMGNNHHKIKECIATCTLLSQLNARCLTVRYMQSFSQSKKCIQLAETPWYMHIATQLAPTKPTKFSSELRRPPY